MKKIGILLFIFLFTLNLNACTYNPLSPNNHTTGNPGGAVIGAAIGAGVVSLLHGSRPAIIWAGLGGAAIGYYVTTLRYASGGVMLACGKVYQLGDYIGIYIPTDQLFEPNTADFLPQAGPILDSVADILVRNPDNNILISGNTSGFARRKYELRLSEKRAERVAAYLWNAGINQFQNQSINLRKLNYVGYGNYFPISSPLTNEGIRENSRIQISSYPNNCDLGLDPRANTMRNIGDLVDRRPGAG